MEIQLAKKTKLRILCFIEPPQFKPISTNCSFKDTKATGQVINPGSWSFLRPKSNTNVGDNFG